MSSNLSNLLFFKDDKNTLAKADLYFRASWKIPSEFESRVKTRPYFLFLHYFGFFYRVNTVMKKYNFMK